MSSSEISAPPSRVVCVVQARMGSTRLPGKVLMDLGGRPMLTLLLERLGRLDLPVVVATSTAPSDDQVTEVAAAAGADVVRGSEHDVLGRYLAALDQHPADHVVRITADCPMTDPAIVRSVVDLHLRTGADYTSNVLPRTFPKGLDVEVVRSGSLRQAATDASTPSEREHVTPHLYRHPERFALANLSSGSDLGRHRWTVDTAEDLDRLRSMLRKLGDDVDPARVPWTDLAAVAPPLGDEVGVSLRPAFEADRDRLLEWRNDPDSVRFSQTRSSVEPAEHDRWLRAVLDDPGRDLEVICLAGEPVGMLRTDIADAVGAVSIAVERRRRGHGVAGRALEMLQDRVRDGVRFDRLRAVVDPSNPSSVALFGRAGFSAVDATEGFEVLEWAPPAPDEE